MRKILSKGEVTTLINSMPNSETIWIDDDRKRNEEFKSILKTGDIENLVKLIRSIYLDNKNEENIKKQEYMYIHLQRRFMKNLVVDNNKFLIIIFLFILKKKKY